MPRKKQLPNFVPGDDVTLTDDSGRSEKRKLVALKDRPSRVKFEPFACVAIRSDNIDQRLSILNVMRSKKLTPTDKVVFVGMIGCFNRKTGAVSIHEDGTQECLAKWLEISTGALSRSLKRLADAGFVLPAARAAGWAINPRIAIAVDHDKANLLWDQSTKAHKAACNRRLASEIALAVHGNLPAGATLEDVRDAVEEEVDYADELYYDVMDEIRRLDPSLYGCASKPQIKRGRGRPRKVDALTNSASEMLAREIIENISRKRASKDEIEMLAGDENTNRE